MFTIHNDSIILSIKQIIIFTRNIHKQINIEYLQFKLNFQCISKRESLIVTTRDKFFIYFFQSIFYKVIRKNLLFYLVQIFLFLYSHYTHRTIPLVNENVSISRYKVHSTDVWRAYFWRNGDVVRYSVGVSLQEWYHLRGTNSTRSISAPAFRIISLCQSRGQHSKI